MLTLLAASCILLRRTHVDFRPIILWRDGMLRCFMVLHAETPRAIIHLLKGGQPIEIKQCDTVDEAAHTAESLWTRYVERRC